MVNVFANEDADVRLASESRVMEFVVDLLEAALTCL